LKRKAHSSPVVFSKKNTASIKRKKQRELKSWGFIFTKRNRILKTFEIAKEDLRKTVKIQQFREKKKASLLTFLRFSLH
jgi:hypothetical protein